MATTRHETRDGRQISAQAQLVRHILSEHQGESNAISAAAIGRMTGLSKRQVADIVRELRLRGEPIGSRPGRPGFWWIVDQREAREVYRLAVPRREGGDEDGDSPQRRSRAAHHRRLRSPAGGAGVRNRRGT